MALPHVLIVGAGPTGLAAALFLARAGAAVRIVEQRAAPDPHSKALVVNPRTLDLLEPTGVATAMRAAGRPVSGVCFHRDWRPLARVDVAAIRPRFPLTAIAQADSEALLAAALAKRGIVPERGVTLAGAWQDGEGVVADLGAAGEARADVLLAADGAHSSVRHALGFTFEGDAFPEAWPLYDVELDTDLAEDRAHLGLFDDGLVFMLALRPGVWRVLGNVADPLAHLPPGSRAGAVLWESSFRIAHRLASKVAAGRIALAGDAAHIHSPVGARGMNLGIEDAFAFAEWITKGRGSIEARIAGYARERAVTHRAVVRRIRLITTMARGRPLPVRLLRDRLMPLMVRIPPVAHMMMRTVTGLDHPVPAAR